MTHPRLIAYYLPQYHPIPENDEWWGKGFTEWTNVAKARSLFKGHYQPHIPADLGFYDLRLPEVREQQAELAREAGIEGFCYWHYWFAGKRILERPFSEVLESGKPDFPFCLGWANASWTGTWYDAPDHTLIEQTYPGAEDHRAHFKALLPAFLDARYMAVDGKPIFLVFQPSDLDAAAVNLWRELASQAGLKGLWLIGVVKHAQEAAHIKANGFDGCTISRTNGRGTQLPALQRFIQRLAGSRKAPLLYQQLFKKPFHVYKYAEILPYTDLESEVELDFYPAVMPGWDNTPRAGLNGQIFRDASPLVFKSHLGQAIERVSAYPPEHQLVIVKSWNEWAEGNHLEPDLKYGSAFLDAIKQVIKG